jgi:hypothetical protein
MDIQLTIPDDYAKRNVYVFAGMDPVARKQRGKEWEIKTKQCSRCGKCCLAIDERHPLGSPNGCVHLRRSPGEQMCGLGIFRPHGCAIADGDRMNIGTCTVKWGSME